MTNSRDKGKRGEYKVRDALSKWTGITFRRTPGSGAFASTNGCKQVAGDLVCDDPTFRFCVEVKFYADWSLESLLTSDICIIRKWWEQAKSQCPNDKKPILFFTKNRAPIFCITKDDDLGVELPGFTLKSDLQETLHIFLYSELIKQSPKIMFNG